MMYKVLVSPGEEEFQFCRDGDRSQTVHPAVNRPEEDLVLYYMQVVYYAGGSFIDDKTLKKTPASQQATNSHSKHPIPGSIFFRTFLFTGRSSPVTNKNLLRSNPNISRVVLLLVLTAISINSYL